MMVTATLVRANAVLTTACVLRAVLGVLAGGSNADAFIAPVALRAIMVVAAAGAVVALVRDAAHVPLTTVELFVGNVCAVQYDTARLAGRSTAFVRRYICAHVVLVAVLALVAVRVAIAIEAVCATAIADAGAIDAVRAAVAGRHAFAIDACVAASAFGTALASGNADAFTAFLGG